jgi:hypothetical protein
MDYSAKVINGKKPVTEYQINEYVRLSNFEKSGLCVLIWYCAFINFDYQMENTIEFARTVFSNYLLG